MDAVHCESPCLLSGNYHSRLRSSSDLIYCQLDKLMSFSAFISYGHGVGCGEVKVRRDRDKFIVVQCQPSGSKAFKIFKATLYHLFPWLLVQETSEMKSIAVPGLASVPSTI